MESLLAKDKEFVAWRAEHPASYVSLAVRQRPKQKHAMPADCACPATLTHAVVTRPVAG